MKKKETIAEMEKGHAAAYAQIPSQAAEFEEWESEQVWLEDEPVEDVKAAQKLRQN